MRHPRNESPHLFDSSSSGSERGQAIMLVLIAVALIAAVAVAMSTIAVRMTDRSAAQSAADAVALAGAISGREAAATVAERNSGRLVSFDIVRSGVDVTVSVQVEIGGEVASARASTASRSSP